MPEQPSATASGQGPLPVTFFVSGRGRLFQRAVSVQDRIGVVVRRCVLDSTADELETWCRDRRIDAVRLDGDKQRAREALAEITPADGREVAVLTFDRLIPAAAVAAWRRRMVNVHPSLLPAFAGARAIERAAASGARFSGATIHEASEEIDCGPIIAQFVASVPADVTPSSLGAAIYAGLEPMLLQVLAWFAQDRVGFTDDGGRRVVGGHYGSLPWSPALELATT